MGLTLIESYKQLQRRLSTAYVILALLVIVLVVVFYLYGQNSFAFAGKSLNYSQLYALYNTTQNQLHSVTAKYNAAQNNLTVPYTKALYTGFTVNIPKKNVSASKTNITYVGAIENINMTSTVAYYLYNFSFNAQYPGYLLLNASSSGINTQVNSTWEFVVSNYNVIPNTTMKYYNFQSGGYYQSVYTPTITSKGTYRVNFDQNSPRATFAPMPTQTGTIAIPVNSGAVHVWIVNFNNQSISVTFSAEYVGFHTH
jgi:4-amino-4-deoxy-L-arabinose transferase-like glycosyltransferase